MKTQNIQEVLRMLVENKKKWVLRKNLEAIGGKNVRNPINTLIRIGHIIDKKKGKKGKTEKVMYMGFKKIDPKKEDTRVIQRPLSQGKVERVLDKRFKKEKIKDVIEKKIEPIEIYESGKRVYPDRLKDSAQGLLDSIEDHKERNKMKDRSFFEKFIGFFRG